MRRSAGRGMFSRITGLAGLLGLAALAALLVSGEVGAATAAGPSQGGSLTVAVEEDCKGFDPISSGILNTSGRSAMMAIEERLFDMDLKGKLVPELGLSATPSKDGKSWTIKLRRGVSFHDGTPFNADAVVTHWERLLDPGNHFAGRSSWRPVASVKKVDEFTVRFNLKHTWLPFKEMISSPLMIANYIPSPKAVKEGTQDRAPVGTGPYRFKQWLSNDRIVVTRNHTYWQKGKPHLDQVTFRTVPDMQTRFSGLKSGELDVILTDRGASILQARQDSTLRVYTSDSSGAETFLINTSAPPLNDLRVRRALAHAWNQEFYVKASFKGTIPVVQDPFGSTLSCGDVGYLEYNPEKARRLIAEYGKPISLDLQITNTARGREFGEMIQRMLKEIGVTVSIKPLTLGQRNKLVFAGNYQLTGWTMWDANDMGPTLSSQLSSSSDLNFSRYSDPQMDKLLETAQTSASAAERKKALCGVAKQINDQAVFLYRGGLHYNAIAKAEVQGLSRVDHGVVRVKDLWSKQPGTVARAKQL